MKRQRERAEILLKKAEEDEVVLDLILDKNQASNHVVGFHLQQAAEL